MNFNNFKNEVLKDRKVKFWYILLTPEFYFKGLLIRFNKWISNLTK
jgi:hypothetical protein